MPEFVTIGVYGYDAAGFFAALQAAHVDTFCDIRRRRAVRGREYAFANSNRLQARLAELGIRYVHRLDLAPSNALRNVQHTVDEAAHVARRQRAALSQAFVAGYQAECMAPFNAPAFAASFGPDARVVALCCVEREPAACHRALLAARLEADLGVKVKHLVAFTPP
jgi:hypothetical protein